MQIFWKGFCKMSEKEIAAKLYKHWYEVNEHTKKELGRENRIAIAGMKKNEWAIKWKGF